MAEPRITPEDLHAFIDGALDEARAEEVGRVIEADAALRQEAASYRNDKAMLTAHYAPVLAKPLPDEWLNLIAESQTARRARPLLGGFHVRSGHLRPLLALAASLVLRDGRRTHVSRGCAREH